MMSPEKMRLMRMMYLRLMAIFLCLFPACAENGTESKVYMRFMNRKQEPVGLEENMPKRDWLQPHFLETHQ